MKRGDFMSIEEIIKAWKSHEDVLETQIPASPVDYELEGWELTEQELQFARAWWTDAQTAVPDPMTGDGCKSLQQA
jgi:hypothetical protein